MKIKHFDNKPRPIGTSWVRRIHVISRQEGDQRTFEVIEQRKPRDSRRYDRDSSDSVILSVEEIEELYRISKGEL